MSRAAAEAGFEMFVDETVEATRQEFRLGRALRGTGLGPGGAVVDRLRANADTLERRIVEPELNTYRRRSLEQFRVVLAYVQSDDPIEAFEDELLAHDSYVEAIDRSAPPGKRQAIVETILARLERLGDGVEPIVDRPEKEFYPAVRAAYNLDGALELVDDAFPFTRPLHRHRSAFTFAVEIDPGNVLGGPFASRMPSVSIDYTDEAVRAMRRAEQRVVDETKRTVRELFGVDSR